MFVFLHGCHLSDRICSALICPTLKFGILPHPHPLVFPVFLSSIFKHTDYGHYIFLKSTTPVARNSTADLCVVVQFSLSSASLCHSFDDVNYQTKHES